MARVPLRGPGGALPRPTQLRRRAARPRHRRARTRPPLSPLTRRDRLDLRRPARPRQPDREPPCRGPRPRPGQPRPAPRPEQPVARRLLVRRASGGRRRRADDAAASPQGAHHDRRDRPLRPRYLRRPLRRRPRCGRASRPPHPHLRRRRGGRPDPHGHRQVLRLHPCRDRGRRRRNARLHLRHDRQAQGDDALPPRRARQRGHVLALRPQADDRRCLHRHAAHRLHLRPRRPRRLPAEGRREHPAHREGHPRPARRPHRGPRRDHLLHRAHCLPRHHRLRQGATDPHPAPGRLGRRAPSRRDVARLQGGHRRRAHRRDRLDRDCSTSSSARRTSRSARDRPASRSRGTAPRSSTGSATTSPTASRDVWRSRDRRAAAISPTSARRRMSTTDGTSPATPSSATPTATSGIRPAATT